MKAALAALPYIHVKPEHSQATDPADSATHIEGGSEEADDPMKESLEAWRRALAEERAKAERFKAEKLKRRRRWCLRFRLVV